MKILFLDLDGTLLNDQKEITKGNRDALQKALDAGHRVVITTGRTLVSAKAQSQRLGLTGEGCYVIAFNGGAIYDCGQKKTIYENFLPAETALKTVRICNKIGVHAQCYDEQYVLVEANAHPDAVEYYERTTGSVFRQVESFDRELPPSVPKVLVISLKDRAALEQAEGMLKEALSGVADCFYSSKAYLEVVSKGINKGNAVARLCALLNIPIEDSIAVGDEENDMSMVLAAGTGVAMANAIDHLKANADYITTRDNNHDGIAEVVEKFLLCQ